MEPIVVRNQRGEYRIHFGNDLHTWLSGQFGEDPPRFVLLVVDENVKRFHGERMLDTLGRTGIEARVITVVSGEGSKSLETYANLCGAILAESPDRRTPVLAFGGGVTGDLAGFLAATILRGLPLYQIPTTSLAQVDSCVGGKVGINHTLGKNLIGSFYQPCGVFVDPTYLATLPERDYSAGLFEAIKMGLALDERLFAYLENHWGDIAARVEGPLIHILHQCCRLKARIVELDELESGPRRVLNFGHTVGHAWERLGGFVGLRHGEAVAWGMMAAVNLSENQGLLDGESADRARQFITRCGPLPEPPATDREAFLSIVERDKKRLGQNVHCVMLSAIGQAVISDRPTPDDIWEAAQQTRTLNLREEVKSRGQLPAPDDHPDDEDVSN